MSSENELGKFVREKRLEKDMSQRELANAAGISNAEISRLESGKRKASSPAVLKAIAKALNVPVEVLLEKSGIIEEGKKAVDKALDEIGDMPVPQAGQSSLKQKRSFEEQTFISVDDLTDDEIADIKRYIEFIKSKRDS
ncbi:helix-turn-helix domain-containing protein [Bacillota bacterium HCP3S3_F1_1]